ncbi:MAG TPA: STAS domain-containing protein, partial [Burkholderiales bacterium]|nr:STAS domain-containing protein [Burkholderiales bacterium]
MRSHAAATAVLEPGPPEGNTAVLRLSGRLDAYSVGPVWTNALAFLRSRPTHPAVIDAAGVQYCDGAGIALLLNLLRQPRGAGTEVELRGLPDQYHRLFDQFDPSRFAQRSAGHAAQVSLTERVGRIGASVLHDAFDRIVFVGESAVALAGTIAHPTRLRWPDAQ